MCIFRTLIEFYKYWRIIVLFFFTSYETTEENKVFLENIKFIKITLELSCKNYNFILGVLDTIFFILFVFSALKSINYFGKGLKELLRTRKKSHDSEHSNNRL